MYPETFGFSAYPQQQQPPPDAASCIYTTALPLIADPPDILVSCLLLLLPCTLANPHACIHGMDFPLIALSLTHGSCICSLSLSLSLITSHV